MAALSLESRSDEVVYMIDNPQDNSGIPFDTSFAAALADREAFEVNQEVEDSLGGVDFGAGASARGISPRPYDMIVRHETGGRNYYEKVYGGRPVWPGEASGVTIGFGYDLGYVTEDQFRTDWNLLGQQAIAALLPCVGKHGGNTSDDDLKRLVAGLKGIVIPWEQGELVFKAVTVPRFSLLTSKSLDNCDALPDDCFGVLVSLTFNRGASYGIPWNKAKDPIDRYREMRAIKADMATRNFGSIPQQIRAMERIWKGKTIETEMTKRREEEAAMFEAGLKAV